MIAGPQQQVMAYAMYHNCFILTNEEVFFHVQDGNKITMPVVR